MLGSLRRICRQRRFCNSLLCAKTVDIGNTAGLSKLTTLSDVDSCSIDRGRNVRSFCGDSEVRKCKKVLNWLINFNVNK